MEPSETPSPLRQNLPSAFRLVLKYRPRGGGGEGLGGKYKPREGEGAMAHAPHRTWFGLKSLPSYTKLSKHIPKFTTYLKFECVNFQVDDMSLIHAFIHRIFPDMSKNSFVKKKSQTKIKKT